MPDAIVPASTHDPSDAADEVLPARPDDIVPVVALGGSAGAIPALQAFFRGVPKQPGLAFAVVIHLDPDRESELAPLLQKCTTMQVVQLHERARVRPDTVYVIPPGKLIHADGDTLALEDMPRGRTRHVAVDLLFRTLADARGPRSAAVVLSGADGDGAIGIKRIKERGGLTIAQDPEESEHSSMPRTAIATGMIDWTLPAGDIAPRLLSYFRLGRDLKLPPEDAPGQLAQRPAEDEGALREILAFLRTRTGRDFSSYKRATIVRRVARRMQVNDTDTLAGYLEHLRTRPGEPAALLQDLLISVTNFFRDADCFAALEPHLREMMRGKAPSDAVRVWVPGCATGEEVYSIAMILCDIARDMEAPPLIQLFATDLDEDAIRVGREGTYPFTIEADVHPERLRRYFTKEHRGYCVRREVRELVLFAHHDVLKDSPFSRLDLVSCRNLLIYLRREAQQRVFQTFHFALRPRALLFLGSSESCEDSGHLFSVLDKKHRLFVQRPLPRPQPAVLAASSTRAHAAQPIAPVEAPVAAGRGVDQPPTARPARGPDERPTSWGSLHLKLLETLAPPSILVDRDYEIVHLSASAGKFLQYAGGEPSRNLLRVVVPALRIELRAALYQAAQSREVAELTVARVPLPDGERAVALQVWPLREMGADLFMVLIDPRPSRPADDPTTAQDHDRKDQIHQDLVARHLDRELERLKLQLRETVEQYEASNEELKASNEELQAMNEELRSATEELETSREELQSINEELTTVNHELKNKVDELGHANSDIQNLMDATQIATVFLDRDLSIMRYTPSAVALFNLIPSDLGRPLADLATRLDYPALSHDAARVLERLVPIEREVGLPDGTWFLTRLLPYRTLEDRIAGVVLSFVDITERKQAEEVRYWLSAVVASVNDAIISFATDGTVLSWNTGAEQVFGYAATEAIGQPLSVLLPGQDAGSADDLMRTVAAGGSFSQVEVVRRRKDGSSVHVSLSGAPIRDNAGAILGGTAIARDVTDARAATEAQRTSEEWLRLVVENAREYAIFSIDLDRRVTSWNSGAERLLGYTGSELVGRSGDIIFTDDDRAAGAPQAEAASALRDGRASDDRVHVRKDGSRFWAEGLTMVMRDAQGQAVGFVKVLRDQTEQREAQQALQKSQQELVQALQDMQTARRALEAADAAKDRFLAVLSHELRNPLASIASASELLMMPKLPASALQKAAEVVQRQARAMKVLLDELLDVSRLTLGRLSLSKRRVALAAIIQNALDTSQPLVQAAGHELVVKLPDATLEVDADPVRLAQVVSNLLSNSAKYTPEGGRIELSTEVFHDEVVVTVSDNGIGMEPAEIDRMFDLFAQGEGAVNRSNGGLGIGLALARNIVELHGGWILASSAGPGLGCQLRVGLPLLGARAEVPVEAPVPQPPTAALAAEGELVLVADDNADAAWGLAKLLELSGFRASLARSGEEALRVAEQDRPTIALLDIGMPDLSGHEVARRLRAQPWGKDMILIAATGWGQETDVHQSMEAGFDAHLTKPLNVGRIRTLVDELAARRRRG